MRIEPTFGTADIIFDTTNEPYITEDFTNIDVRDPREPILGISFSPAAAPEPEPSEELEAEAASSAENADTPVAEQNDNKAASLKSQI